MNTDDLSACQDILLYAHGKIGRAISRGASHGSDRAALLRTLRHVATEVTSVSEALWRLLEEQPCGHAAVFIVGSKEGTNYCAACEDAARGGEG